MKIEEALYQLKQNIKMHEIEGTTSNQNEREKVLLDYITNLQEKLNRIDKLINTDYGWVSYYYKYNNRYLKSEIKEDINNILKGSDE